MDVIYLSGTDFAGATFCRIESSTGVRLTGVAPVLIEWTDNENGLAGLLIRVSAVN